MRLSNSVVSTFQLLGSLIIATLVGVGIAILSVWVWFNDGRLDAYAVLLIASISFGLFAHLVTFTALVSRHHIPSMYAVTVPALLWVSLATFLTWDTCKSSYITWDNWMWVLESGDQRIYELNWIIRGWLAIGFAGLLGLVISRNILERAMVKQRAARLETER